MNVDKVSEIFTKLTVNTGQRLHDIQHVDNPGSDLIHDRYPHIWSQLVKLTYDWSIAGKYILHNAKVLKNWLSNQLELRSMFPKSVPMELRPGVTVEDYSKAFTELYTYLQSEVLPVLERVRPLPVPGERTPRDFAGKGTMVMSSEMLKTALTEVLEAIKEDEAEANVKD